MIPTVFGITALSAIAGMQWSREQGLVVHEWGTFTSLQGSDGVPVKWNPLVSSHLPAFVYDWGRAEPGRYPTGPFAWRPKSSLVTLQRLETPVIYFYSEHEQTVDLAVRFPKGGITEWYPRASAVGPSAVQPGPVIAKLDSGLHAAGVSPAFSLASFDTLNTIRESLIEWRDLKILPSLNADASDLPTDSSASQYFAARDTDSAYVQLAATKQPGSKPELEKFLFYRGVGDFAAPLNVSMEPGGRVSLFNTGAHTISNLFILSIKGKAGSLVAVDKLLPGAHENAILNSALQVLPVDMLQTNISDAMARALVAHGLFKREAVAMVNTWKDSWFAEEGVRVLYLLPGRWTDETLPMTIRPKPTQLVRVMVGRAELITPEAERQLAAGVALATQNRQAAAQELRPLAARLGRFAEPAWNQALIRSTLPPADRAELHGLLWTASPK